MPAERYFHPETLIKGQTIIFKDQEHHHLVNVMRARPGETVEIVNGCGQLAEAILDGIEKKSSSLHATTVHTMPQPVQRIILAQGMPKQNRLEFIMEKGTELGMTELWLFPAARSEKKTVSENQIERLTALSIAAMKQCGRLFLPKIMLMPALNQWKPPEIKKIYFGDTDPEAPTFISAWNTHSHVDEAIICIGPESGFSKEEILSLKKLNAKGVKIHPNILRTETAAIASLSLLSHLICFKK